MESDRLCVSARSMMRSSVMLGSVGKPGNKSWARSIAVAIS